MSNVLAGSAAETTALLRFGGHVRRGALRFVVVGGFASLANWAIRFPLSNLMPFMAAVMTAYGFGMAISFVLYRAWVFPGSRLPLRSQLIRFALVNAVGFATVTFAARVLVSTLSLGGLIPPAVSEALAHALAIAIGAVVNFLGHRALTFARGR